jgi:beta-glucuronidase
MLYPQTNSRRRALKLDGIWQFKKDTEEVGLTENWHERPPARTIPMPVPAAFNEITEDPELRDYYGVVWYFTTLEKPDDAPVHILRFGAAVYHAEVFLNGEKLHESHIGKLPFEVEVSGKLIDGPNRLAVRVDTRLTWQTIPPGNLKPKSSPDSVIKDHQHPEYHFDFLNYGGLLRSVWLLSLPNIHLTGIRLETLADGDAPTGWRIAAQTSAETPVHYRVFDHDGALVAESTAETGGLADLTPTHPQPWSPQSPYLYTLEIVLGKHDRYTRKIGLRTVRVTPTSFLLNGEPIYLKGCGLHEDFHLVGHGHSDARLVRDLTMLKNMGANSFRTSHYPYDETAYQLADELGLLVIDETAAVGFNAWFSTTIFSGGRADERTLALHKEVVSRQIARDHAHPCVIMWSLANEVACHEPEADAYFRELFAHCRAEDPQRLPVTVVQSSMPTSYTKTPSLSAKYSDVLCFNRYYGWYTDQGHLEVIEKQAGDEPRAWHADFPDKPIMITEFGADAIAGMHSSPPVMFTEEYQKETIAAVTRTLDTLPYLIGEHVWNLCDFMTKQGTLRAFGNRKGIHTRDRQPKLAAHFLKERWTHPIPKQGGS